MEQSDVILSLCSKYDLFTTDLVECDSLYIYPTSIRNITLSSGEMLQFMSFFSENKCLHKIGFTESSLLFVAKLRKIKVAAVDVVTQSVCNELGIETIMIQHKKTVRSDNSKATFNSRTSRLNIFKIAACL